MLPSKLVGVNSVHCMEAVHARRVILKEGVCVQVGDAGNKGDTLQICVWASSFIENHAH